MSSAQEGADFDAVVIGGGLAGLCAALTIRQAGWRVLLLEKAPEEERGGNTRFSNGAMRAVYHGAEDVEALVGSLSDQERQMTDFGSYSAETYFDDMGRVTQYRCDPDLTEVLVRDSRQTMTWLREQGVRFLPLYEWQSRLPDGRIRFVGGSAVEINGAGEGAIEALYRRAGQIGLEVRYQSPAISLEEDEDGISAVVIKSGRRRERIPTRRVVLACGGFEADAAWRTRYLGPSWEYAKVRGCRFNTGDGIGMALEVGAKPAGNWSGCHSSSWDANAPDANELANGTIFKRDDYLYGIVVNAAGQRFFDEGADLRSLTYAKLGRAILAQPGQIAWQIYDSRGSAHLHGEYRVRQAARFRAPTLEGLLAQLEGLDAAACLATIATFNAAVDTRTPLDHSRKDGRGTPGLALPKSNWAETIEVGPFEAYAVTCGITFTFGGIGVDRAARVLDTDGIPIPGCYAAGEMVGGLFHHNYPGGSGLMAAAVLGRTAGRSVIESLSRPN